MRLTFILTLISLFAIGAVAKLPETRIATQATVAAKTLLGSQFSDILNGRRLASDDDYRKIVCEKVTNAAAISDCSTSGGAAYGVLFFNGVCNEADGTSFMLHINGQTIVHSSFSKEGCKAADFAQNITLTNGQCLGGAMQYDLYTGDSLTLYGDGTDADCSDSKKKAAIKNDHCVPNDGDTSQKFVCNGKTVKRTAYSDAACKTETGSDEHESGQCYNENGSFKSIPGLLTGLVIVMIALTLA